ncbi:uncharacterized protein LOC131614618 [Vicia villosa]|uniref:uncharacterized protein LOC131614618 n=1 Tax=Vicia villosa TaxID=3911 RepID=UPI00273CA85B|nr:uncharacterized protein LOC131614618 [Vicia villosa]
MKSIKQNLQEYKGRVPGDRFKHRKVEERTPEIKHKNKEMTETHGHTIIKVVRDEDLEKQIGKDICFDLVALNKVKSYLVPKVTSFNHFKKKVATVFDIPVQFQRFWVFSRRQNQTYRPSRPLTYIEESGSKVFSFDMRHINFSMIFMFFVFFFYFDFKLQIGQLKLGKAAELVLFLEVERGLDLYPIAPVNLKKDDILLFFKLYDSEKETLSYVGRLFVNSMGKPLDILASLNELAGFDPDQGIELYEEIKFKPNVMCEPVDKRFTFKESQLENGDIICFQKSSAVDNEKHFSFPDVPSYFNYVHNSELPFSSISQKIGRSKIMGEQNKIIRAEEVSVDENTAAQSSDVDTETTNDENSTNDDTETTNDENSNNSNNLKFIVDSKEVDALIEEDVIDVIDKVLSKEINISLPSHHSVLRQEARKLDHDLPQQLLRELRDIAFKEDLVEKFKEGSTPKTNFNFNDVKQRMESNADAFSSWQLEHANVIVNLLSNIMSVFDKLENLKKEQDTAKKCTDEHGEELRRKRQKILTSKASFTNHQKELKSLDAEIADLKGKLEKLQGDRVKMVEIQDQEKDDIISFNNEVKSIIYRLADDIMKLKNVECNILEAQTELESHEKVYKTFRAIPPF